ncbi:RNA-guided endonuclease InsQ/TnpB family protein [Spirosoma montaniterrae]|uniref:RNA-guided endonuclease InsQ/TnpB family protein n=1 Tax=Spirosoma montaniterrae TaxID=1178516 RepID=UPI00097DD815|nr:RNA-guided endonuclease TnpB family protein [Spirosoma montaniterrae]
MKITAKIHLRPTPEQAAALLGTLLEANAACNALAQYAFEHKVFKQYDLHKAQYYNLKETFRLSSQLIIRCLSKVADSYKLDKENQRTFRATGGIAYDARILSINPAKSIASIWTVDGRLKIPYTTNAHNQRLLAFQKGESDLVLVKGKYFLLLTCDIPDENTDEFDDVLGVDLGIVSIATDSDGQTFSGAKVEAARQWYAKRRGVLQSVGTKSAKRSLKKLSGKQKRFQRDTNHVISKSLVVKAKATSRAISMENLKGISKQVRKEAKRLRQPQRAKHSNWSFDQLKQFVGYKCQLYGVVLTTIDPRNTSRTCHVCGHCAKANRRSQAEFVCRSCFHSDSADVNAAKNIKLLGRQSTGLWSRSFTFQGQAPRFSRG